MSLIADDEDNEFYVSFSSLACPQLHPHNQPNEFRVSWQTMKELSGRWKVALTEVQYNNFHCLANSRYGIAFSQHEQLTSTFTGKITITDKVPALKLDLPSHSTMQLPSMQTSKDERIMFTSEGCSKFNITFDSIDDAKRCGFAELTHQTLNDTLIAPYPIH